MFVKVWNQTCPLNQERCARCVCDSAVLKSFSVLLCFMQLYVSSAALVITSGHGTILLGQASVKLSYMYFCIIINTRYRCCLIQTMCVHVCLHVCIHSTCVCTLYMCVYIVHVHACVHICECYYVFVCVLLCVCVYVCYNVFVCMCVTMCLCVCVLLCVCVYVCYYVFMWM